MGVLLRMLGLQALALVVQQMPARTARTLTLVMLIGANLFPLLALLGGVWAAGDVLVVYWLENVVVGIWQVVKILTATGSDLGARAGRAGQLMGAGGVAQVAAAAFFAVHYGAFTLGHGIFTAILARRSGVEGSFGGFLLMFLVLGASHGLSTLVHWFVRDGRRSIGPMTAMMQPYGRVGVLHVTVIASTFLLTAVASPQGRALSEAVPAGGFALGPSVLPGVVLIVLKTGLDARLHVRAHREEAASTPVAVPALSPPSVR